MLIFGHAGITLGTAALAARAFADKKSDAALKMPFFVRLSRYIDIRLLIIGSLLPDIIDKPIGQYFFRETFSNGRIFAHTLLFLILASAIGYFLFRRYRQVWMLTLAAGMLTHIILDGIWQVPETLFWPVLGFTFPKYELAEWGINILHALISNPAIYVPEGIGLAILIWLLLRVVSRKSLGVFIRRGKIDE
jgi:inner membrane protein